MKHKSPLPMCLLPLLLVSCHGGAGHGGGGRPTALTAAQIADRTKPATVEILVQFEASGVVAELVPDESLLAAELRRQVNSQM